MKKSTKAALLSALVFPGIGHFHLKKYIPGVVLAGSACAGLYFLITKTLERTLQIVDKIQSGEVQADIAVISELILEQPTGSEARLLNAATAVLIISWLVSIVDSYRIGRVQDKDAEVGG